MSQSSEGISLIDFFQERIANPFVFTLFWVTATFNWQIIAWFFLENLSIERKFVMMETGSFPYEFHFLIPLFLTFLLLITLPFLNNLAEFFKVEANNWFSRQLSKRGYEKFVKQSELIKVETEREEVRSLLSDERTRSNEQEEKIANLFKEKIKFETQAEITSQAHEKISTQLTNIQESNKLLEKENSSLKSEKSYLSSENSKLVKDIKNMTEKSEKIQKENTILNEQKHQSMQQFIENDQLINTLTEKESSLENKVANLTKLYKSERFSKNIAKHEHFNNETITVGFWDEVQSFIGSNVSLPTYFVSNFEKLINQPLIGLIVEDIFFEGGSVIYLPEKYRGKPFEVYLVKDNSYNMALRLGSSDTNPTKMYEKHIIDLESDFEIITIDETGKSLYLSKVEVEFRNGIEDYITNISEMGSL